MYPLPRALPHASPAFVIDFSPNMSLSVCGDVRAEKKRARARASSFRPYFMRTTFATWDRRRGRLQQWAQQRAQRDE
jgi:hypothetical protein